MASDKKIASIHIWHDVFNGGYGMHVEDKLKENRRNRKTDTYSDELESYYNEYIKICTRYNSADDIKKWYIEKFGELP